MKPMTMRERMLAVIQGRAHDRVPFVQYSGLAAPNEEIWSLIGRGSMGLIRWSSCQRVEFPNCRVQTHETRREGRKAFRTILHTPEGSLERLRIQEPAFGTTSAREHYIKEPDDYRILLAHLRDAVVHEDVSAYLRDERELGDDGLPMVAVGRTPYQQLWIEWVALEDLCVHLVECPDLMEEVTSTMADLQRRIFRAVRAALEKVPIGFVDFGDNITAPVIGPAYFRKYCVPLYDELAEMLADKDVPVFVHMDGDLKPLWQAIGASKVRGLDSLSPPPDNDTSAAAAAAMWPDMRLFVNFPSSVHLAGSEQVLACARRILQQAGHTGRLQIQISENVPPGAWRKSFPQIVRAIEEFGPPGR